MNERIDRIFEMESDWEGGEGGLSPNCECKGERVVLEPDERNEDRNLQRVWFLGRRR